ncbi:hypothetical protein JCM4914_00170 [Streptomyces platensis subsp. malvinus]
MNSHSGSVSCTRVTYDGLPDQAVPRRHIPQIDHDSIRALAADIWSLGASLIWCWTGHRPVAYDDATDRLEKLAVIAKGTTTALRDMRPWPFPEFEDAVTACLAPDPAARLTAKELTAAW